MGSCPRPPAPTTPLNGLPAGARDLPCPSRRPWKPPRATRAAVDAELSVRAAMDPLLVPLGFARGQGGGGEDAVIIWCAAYTDFTRRPTNADPRGQILRTPERDDRPRRRDHDVPHQTWYASRVGHAQARDLGDGEVVSPCVNRIRSKAASALIPRAWARAPSACSCPCRWAWLLPSFGVQLAVLGLYTGAAFVPTHIGMPIVPRDGKLDFLTKQVRASRNVAGGWWVTTLMGGLNYQIEQPVLEHAAMPRLTATLPLRVGWFENTATSTRASTPRPPSFRREES